MMSSVWKLVSNNSFFQIDKKKKNIYLPNNQTVDGFLVSINFFIEICVLTYLYYCMHTGNGAVGSRPRRGGQDDAQLHDQATAQNHRRAQRCDQDRDPAQLYHHSEQDGGPGSARHLHQG